MKQYLNYIPINPISYHIFSKTSFRSPWRALSQSITLGILLEIALGKKQYVPNVKNKDFPEIVQYLKKKITGQILSNVNIGLDLENSGTVLHRKSLNHTSKLWKLEGGFQARLEMQKHYETKAGHLGRAFTSENLPHIREPRHWTAR